MDNTISFLEFVKCIHRIKMPFSYNLLLTHAGTPSTPRVHLFHTDTCKHTYVHIHIYVRVVPCRHTSSRHDLLHLSLVSSSRLPQCHFQWLGLNLPVIIMFIFLIHLSQRTPTSTISFFILFVVIQQQHMPKYAILKSNQTSLCLYTVVCDSVMQSTCIYILLVTCLTESIFFQNPSDS